MPLPRGGVALANRQVTCSVSQGPGTSSAGGVRWACADSEDLSMLLRRGPHAYPPYYTCLSSCFTASGAEGHWSTNINC